ncbi:MAG: phytase [Myxococcaceae bacterium]|nr:phytase [Myxococcaceae bacterium]
MPRKCTSARVGWAKQPLLLAAMVLTTAAQAQISALVQTEPLPGGPSARTHALVWLHPTDSARSVVYGSDDILGGLYAYDLNGQTLGKPVLEQVYGIDLKQGVAFNGGAVDLMAVASATGLRFFSVGLDGGLSPVQASAVTPGAVTATALMRPLKNLPMSLWVAYDSGGVTQYTVTEAPVGNQLQATLVATYAFPGSVTGLAADDATGRLYALGTFGVFYLESSEGSDGGFPDAGVVDEQLVGMGPLSIFRQKDGQGLVLVPNPLSDVVNVYGPAEPLKANHSFRIDGDAGVGAALRTSVAVVMPTAMGGHFDGGLLVTFDKETARFKFVDWAQVAVATGLPLNTGFNPRVPLVVPNDDAGMGGGAGGGTGTGGSTGGVGGTAGGNIRPPVGGGDGQQPFCQCATGPGGLWLSLAALFFMRKRRRD